MKTINLIKYLFLGIALLALGGGLFWAQKTNEFAAHAAQAEGVVIDLQQHRTRNSTTYRPVVRFVDTSGKTIEFTSSSSNNPPSYRRDEKVVVLYDPDNSQDAKIKGFFSLWGGPLILICVGSLFLLVSGGLFFFTRGTRKHDEKLRATGRPLLTDFQSVALNTSLRVNGRHPFRVLTQWKDPITGEIRIFESHNVWFDPTQYCTDRQITVYIEHGNPKKYYVDLSFLPKLSE